ncbi:jg24984 [Pararge aegeria aegeria]|uniref:Jg24984 protein n=1 Tax=Pararge aegeria aegeria TaxID=348720 RepID=A0A8S4S576_9NEOP|nr:jg24984 [Pararge aegeria aegeria]
MSEEMAVGDKAPSEENKVGDTDAEMEATDSVAASEPPIETTAAEPEQPSAPVEDPPDEDLPETIAAIIEELGKDDNIGRSDNIETTDIDIKNDIENKNAIDIKNDPEVKDDDIYQDVKNYNEEKNEEGKNKVDIEEAKIKTVVQEAEIKVDPDEGEIKEGKEVEKSNIPKVEATRGVKRRASTAFSDDGMEEFKGFENCVSSNLPDYSRIVERLEAEVSAAAKSYKPLKTVMAAPTPRASKRARQDTDSSRPSSALSSRSEGDTAMSTDASPSPAARGGRRATVEMSSPLLRVPLERGWKRELVYRAAGATADNPNRRNADIYYYTPLGKKLRSTREVSEHLSGTGLTLENFSFFKEPLGIDDPEKEIIRDAKVLRRVESPVLAVTPTTLESKRTPKPKPPKGASPEPVTPKSPPAKIKLGRQMLQPCSLTCGRGVPSLACAACLCLYHPSCVGFVTALPPDRFLCKNCRKSSSPPLEPPPLVHKSGMSTSTHHSQLPSVPNMAANIPANTSTPRRLPVPVPVPAKVPKSDKRVLLRMKVAGGGPDGERVWAVAKPTTPVTPTPAPPPPTPPPTPAAPTVVPALPVATQSAPSPLPVCRPSLPQSLAILNGRRFIVVSRALHR